MSTSGQKNKSEKIFDSRYRIVEIVGRGASSVVYRANHIISAQKELALKVLLPKRGKEFNSTLLRRESLALITAKHKYIINLEDFRSVDGLCYLSMQYAPESNLAVFTQKKDDQKLSYTQARRFFAQMAEALAHMHNLGMLHRDVKPDNILVLNEREVRLSDFGVATLPGNTSSLEELKNGVGTLDYMAPEIFTGSTYGPSADLYSLALSFYELITGEHPFSELPLAGSVQARTTGDLKGIDSLAPELPAHFVKIINKALNPDPQDRFKDGIELVTALNSKEELADETARKSPVAVAEQSLDDLSYKLTQEADQKQKAGPEVSNIQDIKDKLVNLNNRIAKQKESTQEETEPATEDSPEINKGGTNESVAEKPSKDKTKVEEPGDLVDDEQLSQADQEEDNLAGAVLLPAEASETAEGSGQSEPDESTVIYQDARSSPLTKVLAVTMIAFVTALTATLLFKYFTLDNSTNVADASRTTTADSPAPGLWEIPKGLYQGVMSTGDEKFEFPLAILAVPAQKMLTVFPGVEGWQPVAVAGTGKGKQQFNVSSGGAKIVFKLNQLNMQGETTSISGYYYFPRLNIKGTWQADKKQ